MSAQGQFTASVEFALAPGGAIIVGDLPLQVSVQLAPFFQGPQGEKGDAGDSGAALEEAAILAKASATALALSIAL